MKEQRKEQLYDAIGALPEEMIAAAAPTGRAKMRRPRAWVAAAACFVCACIVGFGAWSAGWLAAPGEIERAEGEESIMAPESGEIDMRMPWEKRPLAEQYTDLQYNGRSYSSQWCTTEPQLLDGALGEVTVRGYDEIEDEQHQTRATLYRLRGVDEAFAVAVVHATDGSEEALPVVFVDTSWRPATLGELIDGLNLRELMSFGTVYGEDHTMYEDVPDEVIWELMLSDTDLENVYSEQQLGTSGYGQRLMSASVYITALGYRNISLAVTDAGYLKTNIGSTGKAFYIGEERCAQIVSYIERHYEGVAYESAVDNSVAEPEVEMTPQEDQGATTPSYDPRA